jgi:hypothetical protein
MKRIYKQAVMYEEGQKCIACSGEKGNDKGGRLVAVLKQTTVFSRRFSMPYRYHILQCSRIACKYKLISDEVEKKLHERSSAYVQKEKDSTLEKRLRFTH